MSNVKALTECVYEENMLVRMFGTKEEPWFVAIDVLRALGMHTKNVSRSLEKLDFDEKMVVNLTTNYNGYETGNPCAWIISEPGFYRIALSARTEKAKKFQRWVTHDVLPRIRKYGYYKLTPDEKKAEQRGKILKEINDALFVLGNEDEFAQYDCINDLKVLEEKKLNLDNKVYEKEVEEERAVALEKFPYTWDDLEMFGIDVGLAITNLKALDEDLDKYMTNVRGKEIFGEELFNDKFVKRCKKLSAVWDKDKYQRNYQGKNAATP